MVSTNVSDSSVKEEFRDVNGGRTICAPVSEIFNDVLAVVS